MPTLVCRPTKPQPTKHGNVRMSAATAIRHARAGEGLVRRIIRHRADYLYVLPALGVMLLVIGYPIYDTVYLSFFNTPPNLALEDKIFVGIDNYGRILGSESFHEATVNTLVWTFFSTFFAFVIGFGAALA